MSNKSTIDTFFFIGSEKLSLILFEDKNKKIFEKELLIDEDIKKKDLDILIDKFFGENIIKIEKEINRFINEINLIIFSNFLSIEALIKKKKTRDRIDMRDLNHMLFDLKQQIKENNIDKSIIHMRIKSFLLDKKKHLILENKFECSELCLQINFICLSNFIIKKLSKKINKYQISINKIYSEEYLKEYSHNNENVYQTATRLKYMKDENEVHLIKKTVANQGFFERFFRFFN